MGEETKDRLQIPVSSEFKLQVKQRAKSIEQSVTAYVRALIFKDIESSKK
jgi:hypothetical protein